MNARPLRDQILSKLFADACIAEGLFASPLYHAALGGDLPTIHSQLMALDPETRDRVLSRVQAVGDEPSAFARQLADYFRD